VSREIVGRAAVNSMSFFGRNGFRVLALCALVLQFACSSGIKPAPGFSRISWEGGSASVYTVDTTASRIGIYGRNASRLGRFVNLRDYVDHAGGKLSFATNGGMFHADYQPVGLLVQDGVEKSPVNLAEGEGNFFLKPNGVFLVSSEGEAAIVTSERYARSQGVRAATQSGPLLVIDGKINAAFKKGSFNRTVRSGVGVIDPHTVVFVISDQPVSFWEFSRLFRDDLRCKDALYLDGVISQFYDPAGKSSGNGSEFGVLIGVTELP
jgi:uncharacterized protein YigE (DUF2233 family)